MEPQIPLISTWTKGPIGIAHLPRLWLKLRLTAKGRLADGYRSGEGGFDGHVLTHLGLGLDSVRSFIESQPSYVEFEAWVRQNATPKSLTQEAIDRVNEQMLTFEKSGENRANQLEFVGLPVDDTVWLGADLNNLDDWQAFHLMLLDQ